MTRRRSVATAIALAIACIGAPLSGRERVDEVLAQARRAIGADGSTQIVSVSVDASVRRLIKVRKIDISSELHLDFVLPDKYLRTESLNVGPVSRTTIIGLNGDEVLFKDGGAAAAMGLDPRTPGPQRDEAISSLKLDAFRQLTFLLLTPPSDAHCTFAYAGVAEAPDGKADVVDVKGGANRNLRLFFDAASHRLLMATYDVETIDPVKARELSDNYAARLKEQAKNHVQPDDPGTLASQLAEEMRKLPKKTSPVEVHFSGHRAFGPLTLPAIMTVDTAQLQEEWTITSVKLNPPVKPGLFDSK